MMTGRVVFYDEKANYGFIEPDNGSPDVVFSIRAGTTPVEVGDHVGYELMTRSEVTPMGPEALRVWHLGFGASSLTANR